MALQYSNFGRIAAELRIKVFGLVSTHSYPLSRFRLDSGDTTVVPSMYLGLLTTCRIFYAEAVEELYTGNEFRLSFDEIDEIATISPASTHIEWISTRDKEVDLADEHTVERVKAVIAAAGGHCPRLKVLSLNIEGDRPPTEQCKKILTRAPPFESDYGMATPLASMI